MKTLSTIKYFKNIHMTLYTKFIESSTLPISVHSTNDYIVFFSKVRVLPIDFHGVLSTLATARSSPTMVDYHKRPVWADDSHSPNRFFWTTRNTNRMRVTLWLYTRIEKSELTTKFIFRSFELLLGSVGQQIAPVDDLFTWWKYIAFLFGNLLVWNKF